MYNSKQFHLQLNYYKKEEKCIKSTKLFKYKKNNLKISKYVSKIGLNNKTLRYFLVLEFILNPYCKIYKNLLLKELNFPDCYYYYYQIELISHCYYYYLKAAQ